MQNDRSTKSYRQVCRIIKSDLALKPSSGKIYKGIQRRYHICVIIAFSFSLEVLWKYSGRCIYVVHLLISVNLHVLFLFTTGRSQGFV